MNQTIIEQLDIVLNKMNEQKGKTHMPQNLTDGIDKNFIVEILEKLVKDGFAAIDRNSVMNVPITSYHITVEGMLFVESGGYRQRIIKDNAESSRIRSMEISQQKISVRVFWLTVLVAFGTACQATLAVVELYWKYHWFH